MSKANLIAALVLCAFVISRIAAAVMYVGSVLALARREDEEAVPLLRQKLKELVMFVITGALSAIAVWQISPLRLLSTFGQEIPDLIDAMVTWLVLVAGSERLSAFVGDSVPKPAPVPPVGAPKGQPVKVAGTLRLSEGDATVVG